MNATNALMNNLGTVGTFNEIVTRICTIERKRS